MEFSSMTDEHQTLQQDCVPHQQQPERLLQLLMGVLRACGAHVCVYDGDGIRVAQSVGEVLLPIALQRYPCRFAPGDPCPLIVTDLFDEGEAGPMCGPQIQSFAAQPLVDHAQHSFGFVCVSRSEPTDFTDADRRVLRTFSSAIAAEFQWESQAKSSSALLPLESALSPAPSTWITDHDLEGHFVGVVGDFEKFTGFTTDEASHLRLEDLVAPADRELLRQIVTEQFGGGFSRRQLLTFCSKDGSPHEVELFCRVRFAEGRVVGFQASGRPLRRADAGQTARRESAAPKAQMDALDLMLNRRPLDEVLRQIMDASLLRYPESRACAILLSSRAALCTCSTGFPADVAAVIAQALRGEYVELLRERVNAIAPALGEVPAWLSEMDGVGEALRALGTSYCASVPVAGGGQRGALLIFSADPELLEQGLERDLQITARLVSVAMEQEDLRERVEHIAELDPLTGLPNRRGMERLLPAMLNSEERAVRSVAVILLGVEGLRRLRDVYGYHTSEYLLQAAAARLRATLPSTALLARASVEELLVALPDPGSVSAAEAEAVRLQRLLREPLVVDGREHYVMASAGLAYWPTDSPHAAELVQMAEAALAEGRRRGNGQFCRYGSHSVLLSQRRETENRLRAAVERGELRLGYQPQVDLDGNVTGAEALLFWESTESGVVPASDFISIAEESGLIIPIGRWVLQSACRQFSAWVSEGLCPGILAVNVSPLEFEHPDFVEGILRVLDETGTDPRCVELELTERTVVNNVESAERRMNQIGQLGVRFALDDFGTGYSSLGYLKGMPVHTLKIDRSFVEQIAAPSGTLPLIHTLVILAHNLGLRTVAEGVETQEQWDMLRAARCDCLQGYLFGKTLGAGTFSGILRSGRPLGTPQTPPGVAS